MIISGGSRSNWRFFATHLTNKKDNDRVSVVEIRGLAGESVQEGLSEMAALASGTRCKNFIYHADLNPREDEHLTPEQWERAVDLLESKLGLEGQSRVVVEHEKNGRTHRHVIWSRINPDTMTAISDSQNYAIHEAVARELEREFGHEAVRNTLTREAKEKRPDRNPKNWEVFRGNKSGLDPKAVTAEVTALWHGSESGAAFKAALESRGYILCRGEKRDFCIVDHAGKEHSLARRIAGVKAAELRARMTDVNRDALPTVDEGRAASSAWGEDADTDGHKQVRRTEAKKLAKEYVERQAVTERKRRETLNSQYVRDMNQSATTEIVISTAALTEGYTNKVYFERLEVLRERAVKQRESMMRHREESGGEAGYKAWKASVESPAHAAVRRDDVLNAAHSYIQAAKQGRELEPSASWTTRMRGFIERTARNTVESAKGYWAKYVDSSRHKKPAETPEKPKSWRERLGMRGPEMEPGR